MAVVFSTASAQEARSIQLDNPSFEEDRQAFGTTPNKWVNVGDPTYTPPDIQPGFFGVSLEAQHGDNYVSLAVRQDNTWEGIGQKLKSPLKKGKSYAFSVWLTRSQTFISAIRDEAEPTNFKSPTILKIWGYNTKTNKEELLAESVPVGHSKWVCYTFVLSPTLDDFDQIDLTAYYAPGFELKNGHLLLDNCSDIKLIED